MSVVRAPVTETTERFLRGILTQVPLDRIEELHLFLPLRQGVVETGIAVVAARVILPELKDSAPLELSLATDTDHTSSDANTGDSAVTQNSAIDDSVLAPGADPDDSSPYAPDVVVSASAERISQTAVEEHVIRHTVYTARYRLVIKGPERGRWELDVVDEADAPLLTIETVVRGVQQRAGEATATVRYDARQLAAVLRLPEPVAP